MAESSQKKLTRVRRPRVQIIYEVETGGATVKKELPFVVGVLGDFSADGGKDANGKKKPLKERNFVNITGANFSDVMEKIGPKLVLKKGSGPEADLPDDFPLAEVNLEFKSMDDFSPENLVTLAKGKPGIPQLNALLQTRSDLADLIAFANRSPELERLLQDIVFPVDPENPDGPPAKPDEKKLAELKKALGLDDGTNAAPADAANPATPPANT